jgi:hypothetical protein
MDHRQFLIDHIGLAFHSEVPAAVHNKQLYCVDMQETTEQKLEQAAACIRQTREQYDNNHNQTEWALMVEGTTVSCVSWSPQPE